jgi:hypothetical protein
MKKPIYKKYSIFYDGTHREDISATSKQNVREYIKDHYITYLKTENGIISEHFYRLKNFEVRLIEPKN